MNSERTEQRIEGSLQSLNPTFCQIHNFSDRHSRGKDSHFAIRLVSDSFVGMNRLQRQQAVNRLLLPLLHNPVHAWTFELFTQQEWQGQPESRKIPECAGRSDETTEKI